MGRGMGTQPRGKRMARAEWSIGREFMRCGFQWFKVGFDLQQPGEKLHRLVAADVRKRIS